MKDNKSKGKQFQTSIREPRWQQYLSIGIVLLFVAVEAFVFVTHFLHSR